MTAPDVWRRSDIASLSAVYGEQENPHFRKCRLGLTLNRTTGVHMTFEEFDFLRLPHSEIQRYLPYSGKSEIFQL